MKRVAVLGSTGSIGCSTLDVAAGLRGEVRVTGLAAGRSWQKLAEQCRGVEEPPRLLAMGDLESAERLEGELGLPPGTVLRGPEGVAELAAHPDIDVVVTAMVGAQGLRPTLAAVEAGKTVALANKEPLVAAGELVMAAARRSGARILPVDSEHSALFQLLQCGRAEDVRRIVLCASGGPFREWLAEKIEVAGVADALNHPTWDMGRKITVDSATLMNKGLEVIEAHWLFGLEFDRIEVLVQPESVVHAMVEFRDGTLVSHMGLPDMRTPIQYALTWPERRDRPGGGMTLADLSGLTFDRPDTVRFPCLELGYSAGRAGGTAGAVLNAANEAAVALFLEERIPFGEIPRLVESALKNRPEGPAGSLEDVVAADSWAREFVGRSVS
ncbi:MAG: 1-deoxy-D-xylulose-5-phosphate reductoisomerase [Planctomycetota bacterium]